MFFALVATHFSSCGRGKNGVCSAMFGYQEVNENITSQQIKSRYIFDSQLLFMRWI